MILGVSPMFSGANPIPSFVSASSTYNSSTSFSPLVIEKPSGVAVGNLLVAAMAIEANETWTGDTGWTEVFDSGSVPSLRVAYKIAGADEPASYTFTADGIGRRAGVIIAYKDAAFDLIGAEQRATSATITAPSVTATENCVALAFFAHSTSATTLATPPSGWDQRIAVIGGAVGMWAYDKVAPPGATGTADLVMGALKTNSGIQLLIKRA